MALTLVDGALAAPSTGSPSSAATAPATDSAPPEVVERARKLWYEGVKAFRAKDYEAARKAFDECYRLMPKLDVLRNLSISEIQSGHYLSAARHLSALLSNGNELDQAVRLEAEKRLAQAEAKVGRLAVTVDVLGAEVSVDGEPIGTAPLESTWYVLPGEHHVSASSPEHPEETRRVFALAGVSIPVDFALEALRVAKEENERLSKLEGSSNTAVMSHPPLGDTESDRGLSTTQTVTLATAGGLTALGLASGIFFTVRHNDWDSKFEGRRNRLSGGAEACGTGTALALECDELAEAKQNADEAQKWANISFIGAGVAGAVTLTYALVVAFGGNEKTSAARSTVTPLVALGEGAGWLGLAGHF